MGKISKTSDGPRIDKGFQGLGEIFNSKRSIKPPAYPWQDLALRVIEELDVPDFKRNSVFKACKEMPKSAVESCLNDTKELCKTGEKWKYFFKLVDNYQAKNKKSAT